MNIPHKLTVDPGQEWKEMDRVGDHNCPRCTAILIIVPVPPNPEPQTSALGYCLNCGRVFELVKKE